MESEKLGPRARDPHLAVASVSFRVPAAQSEARGSGRVSTASPQPSPDSPAPPRRLDGSLLLVQVPAFRWFGPLTQPPLLIRGLDSAFFQKKKKKVGTQNRLGKGQRWRVRSEVGVESRNGGRKGVAEDLCTGFCQGEEGVGPEAL